MNWAELQRDWTAAAPLLLARSATARMTWLPTASAAVGKLAVPETVWAPFTTVAAWGQFQPPPIVPIPIPGGDVIPAPGPGVINSFFPGIGGSFDGQDADPHGITNFKGSVAMGYTLGTATDNSGKQWAVITDIRVYQGDYVGAQPTFGAGGSSSAKAHGTFVEI